jgi:hypothetical protein
MNPPIMASDQIALSFPLGTQFPVHPYGAFFRDHRLRVMSFSLSLFSRMWRSLFPSQCCNPAVLFTLRWANWDRVQSHGHLLENTFTWFRGYSGPYSMLPWLCLTYSLEKNVMELGKIESYLNCSEHRFGMRFTSFLLNTYNACVLISLVTQS